MRDDREAVESLIRVRVRRVNALASGVVAGLVAGIGMFLATNWLVLKGGHPVGPHLALLGQFFVGYRVSFSGSLIGLAYGFVTGLVVFFCGAALYNGIANRRATRRAPPP
jgi:hypothetical protein